MTYSKTYNSKRRIGVGKKPVSFSLVKIIASMRKACFNNEGTSESDYKHNLAAKELVVLGRLINSWRDVVGIQLASKTCPLKLFKGTLYLTVSDSQWMQTLLFLKAGIIQKLDKIFPDLKIKDILGRIGKIPASVVKLVKESAWPDWKEEEITEKPKVKNPELAKSIDKCQQKLSARLKGLEEKGYRLCKICRANVTRSKDGICAMCLFDHRSDIRMKSRSVLAEMPWLSFDEVCKEQPELTSDEYNFIKNELLNETLKMVDELYSDLNYDYDEETAEMIRKEMIRGIILYTGITPDQIELNKVKTKQLPDKKWQTYLKLCC
ncbi:MAG: DUF721 domain-containing protein [Candidatus Riflebacteria bacterium]|nr:DUF721 domain-containing protein [Candidatus Riflebacteria bacterium]